LGGKLPHAAVLLSQPALPEPVLQPSAKLRAGRESPPGKNSVPGPPLARAPAGPPAPRLMMFATVLGPPVPEGLALGLDGIRGVAGVDAQVATGELGRAPLEQLPTPGRVQGSNVIRQGSAARGRERLLRLDPAPRPAAVVQRAKRDREPDVPV